MSTDEKRQQRVGNYLDCIECGGPRHKGSQSGLCSACYWDAKRASSPYTGLTQSEYDAQRYDGDARRDEYLRKRYGITADDYLEMWDYQEGLCALCGKHESEAQTTHGRLVVDHNHATGAVRALLCDLCNKGLGQFGDDVNLLHKAVRYLEIYDV